MCYYCFLSVLFSCILSNTLFRYCKDIIGVLYVLYGLEDLCSRVSGASFYQLVGCGFESRQAAPGGAVQRTTSDPDR